MQIISDWAAWETPCAPCQLTGSTSRQLVCSTETEKEPQECRKNLQSCTEVVKCPDSLPAPSVCEQGMSAV